MYILAEVQVAGRRQCHEVVSVLREEFFHLLIGGQIEESLATHWTHSDCPSVQRIDSVEVTVELPYPVELVVTNSPIRILGNPRDVPIADIPSTVSFDFSLLYSDGSSEVVRNNENIRFSASPSLSVEYESDSISVSANDTSLNTTASVNFWYTSLSTSVLVTILNVEELQVGLLPYPNEARVEETLSHIDLEQLESTGYWQQAELVVEARLSDGSVERVTDYTVSNQGVDGTLHILVDNNGIIQVLDGPFGTNRISARSGQLESINNVTVSTQNEAITVDRIELDLTNVSPSEYQYIASVFFVDGTQIDDVTDFSRDVIGGELVTFSLSPEDVGSIDTATGTIDIDRSHYDEVTLTASLGTVTTTRTFAANLEPEIGASDLGAAEGVPIPAVSLGENITFDVRINTDGYAIEALDIALTYNKTALEFVSISPQVGFSSVRSSDPIGEIQLVAISRGQQSSSSTTSILTIATVTFRTLSEGIVNIAAHESILITTNFSIISPNSREVLSVRVGSSPSTVYTPPYPTPRPEYVDIVDINEDDIFNVNDAHYAFVELGNGNSVSDTNWDNQFNIRDVVYLTRVASRLAPVLLNLPTITQPRSPTDCLLIFDQIFSFPGALSVYGVISHPGIATELNVSLTGDSSLQYLDDFSSGIFTTALSDSDSNSFSLELYTPLDVRDTPIGYSIVVRTFDERGESSSERRTQFIGGATSTQVGENEDIPRINSPFAIGESSGFRPLQTFTVSELRSDYCSFNGSTIELRIEETAIVGVPITTLSAVRTDLEFPSREEQYSLTGVGVPDIFSIEPEGTLYLNSPLDFETQPSYILTVEGETEYDDGYTAVYSATINVTVIDINDETPQLSITYRENEVPENVTEGYRIAGFTAIDRDTGLNGEVDFTLVPSSDPLNQFLLIQNGNTADLLVNGQLDRETTETYYLTITVTDRGEIPLYTTIVIELTLLDVNDNAPVFSQLSYTIVVQEENTAWTHFIEVSDPDLGTNAEVELFLVNASYAFEINNKTHVISLRLPLDRETEDSYYFIIVAIDGGDYPQLTSSVDVTVLVQDINDNAPVLNVVGTIEQPLPIEDDSVEGTFIAQFEATDNDEGLNSAVSFRILETEFPFHIDSVSGTLTLRGSLDARERSEYDITVVVEDGGHPILNDSFDLVVFVIRGKLVSFDAGQDGFLPRPYIKVGANRYAQSVGYLTGQDIGTSVSVRGNINFATVAEDVVRIPNIGGPAVSVRGSILQSSVAYSQRTIAIFLQAFDGRNTIPDSTPIRVRIQANITTELYEGSCTTSPTLGYCILRLSLPNSWFTQPTRITAVYANLLGLDENGENIGSVSIIPSPVYSNNFNTRRFLLVPPAHDLFPSSTFTAEIHIISPLLYEAYDRVEFDVQVTGANFVSVSSDETWNCRKEDLHVICEVGRLPPDSSLRLTVLTFSSAPTPQPGSITLTGVSLSGTSFTQPLVTESISIMEVKPYAYFGVAKQPDIINTLSLSDVTVSSSISLFTINNNVIEDTEGAVNPVTDTSGYVCGHNAIPSSITVDCTKITLREDILTRDISTVSVTITISDLLPAHATANVIVYHIWSIAGIDLKVEDERLDYVMDWSNACELLSSDLYQSTQIIASASISSGSLSFTADISNFIADNLAVTDNSIININTDTLAVNAVSPGVSDVILDISPGGRLTAAVEVSVNPIEIYTYDVLVGTLKLSLTSPPPSRLGEGVVSLEFLEGIIFLQEQVTVTASVVYRDGQRIPIHNPLQLLVNSSDSSVVSVSGGNILTGVNEGEAVISVSWINPCGVVLQTKNVSVTVILDDSRPTFSPDSLTTGVPEDAAVGYIITTVRAEVEGGIGATSDVQYRFKDGENYDGLFTINALSGVLQLTGQVDRETIDSYTLFIEATNSAQRRAEAGPEEEEEENMGSGSGASMLTPDPTPDSANISLNIAILTLRVEVEDVNDNAPVCVAQSAIQLDRTSPAGEYISTIQLTDADVGVNAEIEYVEIKEGLQNEELIFDVGPTGNISTSGTLSQGGSSVLTPVVVARDRGEPPNTVECTLVVRLYDLDQVVALTLNNPYNEIAGKVEIFETVLSDILGDEIADVYVVELIAINETHTRLEVYAVNPKNEFIGADDLQKLIQDVADDEILVRLGFEIAEVDVVREEPEIVRKIPEWAVVVIVVLNSVIVISVLVLVLVCICRRYSRMRTKENQRMLNKRTGLRDFDSVADSMTEGERIEMGGVVHPNRGALVYKKTTKVETVNEADKGKKKIKKVTSETSWLGKQDRVTDTTALVTAEEGGGVEGDEAWHDEEVEQNPLYSTREYDTDFDNPLYSRRLSGVEGMEETSRSSRASGGSGKDGGRAARGRPSSQDTGGKEYVDYLSQQPDLDQADTLF